jgi:hypothetical protein
MANDHLHREHRPLYDSGYTEKELAGIFKSLVNGVELDWLESFVSAFVIGVCDGEIAPLARGGTVRLRTPRSEIDRRVAAVRATMREGATFRQAFCDLPGE